MMIASFLAPACGVAVYLYYNANWTDTPPLSRLADSLLGGFVLLFFTWFITLPLGVLTYFVCRTLAAA
jgi:RsiW-degrading membrane proteinase PrsW (M82 family)